jgi:hypothetical protein
VPSLSSFTVVERLNYAARSQTFTKIKPGLFRVGMSDLLSADNFIIPKPSRN